jgi:uncharacterized protein with ParB-like and HNH nuclease domain
MKFLDAHEITMQNLLLDKNRAYKVPIYQRPYVWNEEQWQELYDDLSGLTDPDIHFLGSIVVVTDKKSDAAVEYFQIVDGQQRLATILVWLAALRDALTQRGESELADYITGFLFITQYSGGRFVRIPKLVLGEFDNPLFQEILEGNGTNAGDSLLGRCYTFFRKKIDGNILSGLLNKISIVHINVFSHLNAFRLFDTLNDRGLELSSVDLVKNFLLMKVSDDREIFDETVFLWNEMFTQVRDKDPVKFLRRYVLSRFRGKVPEARLYEKIMTSLGHERHEAVRDFTADLAQKAIVYDKIVRANFSSEVINRKLRDLHLVEATPSYSLLLVVFSAFEDPVRPILEEDAVAILSALEAFHIRWGICGRFGGKLDQIYNTISLELSERDPAEYRAHITDALREELIDNGIDDDTFAHNFVARTFKANESRTKYILMTISRLMNPDERPVDVRAVTTEHIMPVILGRAWRDELAKRVGSREEMLRLHRENLGRIGNLTLITGDWNLGLSNRPFAEKKERKYYWDTELAVTNSLIDYKRWGFPEIDKRSRELYEIVRKQRLWTIG